MDLARLAYPAHRNHRRGRLSVPYRSTLSRNPHLHATPAKHLLSDPLSVDLSQGGCGAKPGRPRPCSFLPQTLQLSRCNRRLPPTPTSVLAFRPIAFCEQTNDVYSHEVIAHQLITSAPTIVPAPPASPVIGTENVNFCNAVYYVNPGRYACGPDFGWLQCFH